MAQSIAIKGKEKILTHFKFQKQPFWKIFTADSDSHIVQQNLTEPDFDDSLQLFIEVLDILNPESSYILQTFPIAKGTNKAGKEKPSNVESSRIVFTLAEGKVSGTEKEIKINPLYDAASLKGHIDLIKENAKLSIEMSMYKDEADRLRNEVARLKMEVEEMEAILEEEEEEEEEENARLSGTPLENAVASLIKEGMPLIREHFAGKKIVEEIQTDENNNEPEIDNIKVSGIETKKELPALQTIISELQKVDDNLQYHLFKLLCVAQQKPYTFKALISQLNKM